MPLYDYKCADHGHFQELVPMAQSANPCDCPRCGKVSPRIIVIPPQVLAMAPEKRRAMAINEKSRHEPLISTPEARQQALNMPNSRCGCQGGHKAAGSLPADKGSLRQQVVFLPDGSKVFPSQRPWMISH